jgi:hypothetical protein
MSPWRNWQPRDVQNVIRKGRGSSPLGDTAAVAEWVDAPVLLWPVSELA